MTARPSASRRVAPRRAFQVGLDAFHREALAGTCAGTAWKPSVFRLKPGDRPGLEVICAEVRIVIVDEIHRQLEELAEARLPGADRAERERLVREAVEEAGGSTGYGNWVLLPWESRLVHLLPEAEYLEVVTNRNHDKITPAEQRLLRSRRVGVVGLSVGAEAAVSIAQEHLCGEMRLADFDPLSLSNLNRLGAGFDEIGENKAILAARRIAKLDPYLEVVVQPEGVTESNLETFLKGLDLVVEECDSPPVKQIIRQRARALGIDLVFAADERGFLSVEPYRRHPELEPFHGLLASPQLPRGSFDSPADFFRCLTEWMGGWDQLSERSKLTLERLGRTRAGYPQLASEARYAAGQIGHVARRLLLDEAMPPFVGHLDLHQLLSLAAADVPGEPS